jgi:uncharacterized repeat protein (TIGR02543 family)
VQIEEPGGVEPPPNPPPVIAPVLTNVEGNGSIVSVGRGGRTTAGAPSRHPIRCGVFGVACVTEVAPGDTVRLHAQPSSGYVFGGWTNGCKGSNPTCTVSAGTGNTVSARFPRRQGKRTVAIQIKPRIKASFKQSAGSGTLILNGTISAPASLRVQLRRPGGAALLTRRLRVGGGPFGLRALLKRGTLAGGAYFLPGGFVVTVRGGSGPVGVPLQMRSVFVKPPLEGVVRRAYASTTAGGRPQKTLPSGSKQAWAIFRFATQPTGGPLTATWYDRSGNLIGTREKSNRPIIRTGIGSSTAIPSGTWRVELRAGGKLAKQLRITIR